MEMLNKAEEERIIKLMEEASEIIQCCSKILMYGYEEINILEPDGPSNKEKLEKELGDFIYWLEAMCVAELDAVSISVHSENKHEKAMRFTRYQEGSRFI